jgi:hypothetical protein
MSESLRRLRLRFWLACMDAAARCGLFGSRLYRWLVAKASDAVDWGDAR